MIRINNLFKASYTTLSLYLIAAGYLVTSHPTLGSEVNDLKEDIFAWGTSQNCKLLNKVQRHSHLLKLKYVDFGEGDIDSYRVRYNTWMTKLNPFQTQVIENAGISIRYLDTTYDQASRRQGHRTRVFINDKTINNNTSIPKSSNVTNSYEDEDVLSWAITKGLKSTTEINGSVPIPTSGNIGFNKEIELSFSRTGTQTEINKRVWEMSEQVTTPPHTLTKTSFFIDKVEYTIPFTTNIEIKGNVGIIYQSKLDPTSMVVFTVPVTRVFTELPRQGYKVIDNSVIFEAKGIFKSCTGLNWTSSTTQSPLLTFPNPTLPYSPTPYHHTPSNPTPPYSPNPYHHTPYNPI